MSCVNQVYDTSNANFQASVTIPSGGEILGGYDASLNQLIFAYENICDPAKVTDLTSGWTSPYVSNKNKIGLDDNCAGSSTSTPVLLYDTPSSYDLFNITQMAIFNDPSGGESIIVCGGWCVFKFTNDDGRYGFIFSFYLATGKPYTVLDGGISSGTTPQGWFIKEGNSNVNINQSLINCIYTHHDTIIYGGWKYETTSQGPVRQRPLLEKIVISGGSATTTTLISNEFTGYNDSDTEVTVVDITPSIIGILDNCLVIYQTVTQSAVISKEQDVHIRELDFTGNVWKTNDFILPFEWGYSQLQYTSSCIGESTIYIAAGSLNFAALYVPLIYAIKSNGIAFELIPMFASHPTLNNLEGVQVYGKNPVHWTGLQIDNISYITMNTMSGFVGVNTNTLFVTLSSVDSQYYPLKNKYISFISALTGSSQPPNSIPFNNPNSNILNALISQDSPTSTNDTIILTKNNQNLIQVQLDNKLDGTLNDLQFKLAFCSSKLHLFAFGNYVNSPSNASVSSFALLNAISWICLSKGTQILCDQGIINIEKINTRKHTINNKPINHITQSIHTDDYLIKIKKNCLSSNSPSSDIICSGDHKILYKNNLIEAKNLINEVYGIEKIKNDKRVLYNILMDKHEVIMANNTPVESLHPQNIMALFYNNYNNPQAREFLSDKIGQTNNYNIHVNKINKNKLNGLMVGNKISKKMSLKM